VADPCTEGGVCDHCSATVSWGRYMTRGGNPAFLGGSCGCFARWLHWRELREFEDTGVI
jgi:hypothetical protein